VYSVGVLLWEISSGRQPFESFDDHYKRAALLLEITNGKREIPIHNTPIDYVNIYTSMNLFIILLLNYIINTQSFYFNQIKSNH
jgi:hypothetical protein